MKSKKIIDLFQARTSNKFVIRVYLLTSQYGQCTITYTISQVTYCQFHFHLTIKPLRLLIKQTIQCITTLASKRQKEKLISKRKETSARKFPFQKLLEL